MLEELKEEQIVNKVGGRFKLSTLIQKRLVALNRGSRPLIDLQTKKVVPGAYQAPALTDKIPPVTVVHRYNFIPNPPVYKSNVNKIKLWGFTVKQLCTY